MFTGEPRRFLSATVPLFNVRVVYSRSVPFADGRYLAD